MQITKVKKPVEYLIVDDVYTAYELEAMWKEIKTLQPQLKGESETSSAKDADGNLLKRNKSILINNCYKNIQESSILMINHRVFNPEITKAISELHPSYNCINFSNRSTTLLNYYDENNEYKPHFDMFMFTYLTFLVPDNKEYTGGDFLLSDFNHVIEQKNNRVVVFPSGINHQVTPVKLNTPESQGRFSLAQFLYRHDS